MSLNDNDQNGGPSADLINNNVQHAQYSIDPNDGIKINHNGAFQDEEDDDESEVVGILKKNKTSDSFVAKPLESWDRRPSFLGFGISGSAIKTSKENDKLLNYLEKSSRIDTVQELRHLSLIGKTIKLFNWDQSYINESKLKSFKNRKIRAFYLKQNELIDKYKEVDKLLDSGIQVNMIRNYSDRNGEDNNNNYGSIDDDLEANIQISRPINHRKDSAVPGNIDLETGVLLGYNKEDEIKIINFAIIVNFIANIVLLFGKIIVAILTSSISIVASVIDSALDFLSTLIIFFSNKLANTKNSKKFPIGRARLEPIGVLVFSIIIIISFLQVGIEALQRLIHDSGDEIVEIGINSTIIMITTIIVKLVCYFWCKTIKSSSVAALAQDALVDVIFNTFSIIMPVIGYHFQLYWFDPLGALLLSIYIVIQWSITCFEHIIHLTGKSADKDDERVILYLCSRFAEKILQIKNINCYHVGDSLNVEVDLILDENLSIRDSHDLAEALQYTLEALPIVNIERAFVHIDYTVTNYKGHLS